MNMPISMPMMARQADSLAFLAFPAKRAAQQVSGTTEELFQSISKIINSVLGDMLAARTSEQFTGLLARHFNTYLDVMLALSKLIKATVPLQVIDRLAHESMSEMESDFRDCGAAVFGTELRDQAMFTVWTLRKINDLAETCETKAVRDELRPDDRQMFEQFILNVLYGRFHLDCLKMSVRKSIPVYPEVSESLADGLRAIVNAYAYVKQAADLRNDDPDEPAILIDFDEEEQELVAASMNDLSVSV